MMPMGRVAGTAAAIIGAVATLGGALIGAAIDAAYDGTVTPFALSGVLLGMAAFVLARWSDPVWERDADRDLMPAELARAAVAAPRGGLGESTPRLGCCSPGEQTRRVGVERAVLLASRAVASSLLVAWSETCRSGTGWSRSLMS